MVIFKLGTWLTNHPRLPLGSLAWKHRADLKGKDSIEDQLFWFSKSFLSLEFSAFIKCWESKSAINLKS